VLALIFGVVAQSAAEGNVGVEGIEEAVGRLGGRQGGAAAWIGYEFLYLAALVAFAAVGQIAAMRTEEADGHLDNLLARRVSRRTWLAGRLGFGVALVALAGLATGLGGWIGLTTGQSDIGLADMLQAGLNVVAPALFVLGVGALLYGFVPRLAVPILYGLVLWSFLIEIIGSSITTNHWLLDTAVLSHLGPVPAASLEWVALAWLTSLGMIAALAGLAAFNRRDLAAA
jgi:ABC-2 type transport system permease protein